VVVAGYMALIPMFLGYLMFGFGLARVPASTATTLTLAEPAVAAVLAVLVVGETLGAVGWIGLGIIASVLVILAVAPTNAPQPAHRFGPTGIEIQEPQGIS
jgi:DME family drug/metabolite transporter